MSSPRKSIFFAMILCIVCSLLLTAANSGLKTFQQRNMQVDRQKNILEAFNIVGDQQRVSFERVGALYNQYIKTVWIDAQGRISRSALQPAGDLPLYIYLDHQQVQAYAVPIDTRGLWGEIRGYLAIENDGTTIRGFTVYQQTETPGLGAEIESRWFRKNFQGKKIVTQEGNFASIHIAKGRVQDTIPGPQQPNYVDGISGATLTGKFLSSGFKEILKAYEPVAIEFRHRNPRYLRVN